MEEEGQNVRKIRIAQMEKIEELTLYMIEMNKKMEELKKEMNELKKENAELKKNLDN